MKTIIFLGILFWSALGYLFVQNEQLKDRIDAYETAFGMIDKLTADKKTHDIICTKHI
jgi:hypothetical protein